MESITVYQTIPHPGIQGNLNSYYSQQVRGVWGEPGWAGGPGGGGRAEGKASTVGSAVPPLCPHL